MLCCRTFRMSHIGFTVEDPHEHLFAVEHSHSCTPKNQTCQREPRPHGEQTEQKMCRNVPENGNPVAVFQLPERFIAKRRKRCQRSKKTNGNHHARFLRNQVRDFPNLLNGAEEEAA